MAHQATFRTTMAACLLSLALLSGCKTAEDKALDQAKAQAAATSTPQRIQYIDKNGDTVNTTVQPPVPGQPQQISTTTAPPAPGPKPHSTKPVVTPLSSASTGAIATANPAPLADTATTGSTAPAAPDSTTGTVAPVAGTPAASTAPISLSLPAGTELAIRVNQHISVKHSVAGERFTGEVAQPVTREGTVVIPRGTPVVGRIDAAHRRGHFKGRSILELRLTSMTLNGTQYALDTHDTVRTKKGKGKRTAGWIGGMTGAGMLIGGIASGGVGLALGAASGAGAGTLIAGTTGNRDIEIPAESIVRFRLADRLVVQNP